MLSTREFCVVLARGEWKTVLFIGTFDKAKEKARELNTMYQTDEYRVEEYQGFRGH